MAKNNEKSLHDLLKNVFGFEQFKGNQEAIIKSILAGNNTFVLMPTGGGKSLCYQLPALMSEGTTIVVSPLIALMKNQVDMIRNFGTDSGIAHVMNSSLSKSELLQVKEDLTSGKTKLLYVAPESLTKEETVDFLRGLKISFFAIDEAHCISEWGHDFRPEYRRLRPIINAISPKLPVIALTATATVKVQKDILKNLEIPDAKVFKSSFDRSNLHYEVRSKTKDVVKDIIKYIKNNPGKSGIVYCLSRKKVEELAEVLVANGIRALPYHAGLDSQTRRENQDKFLMEEVDIIVATIAFGMGIDKPDVRFVCHIDLPESLESYFQEAGRAGRDGLSSKAVLLWNKTDLVRLKRIFQVSFPPLEYIADIYQKMFMYLGIAYGDGEGTTRKFNLMDFAKHYKLHSATAYYAIKYIELSGYWSVTEEIDNPSRVMFSVKRDDLYRIQLNDPLMDVFLKAMMRIYPALFSHFVSIDEEYIAKMIRQSVQEVKRILIELSRMRVIDYIPQSRSPLIFINNERLTPDNLKISKRYYEERKESFGKRTAKEYK